jgi:Transmembrane secretion effector
VIGGRTEPPTEPPDGPPAGPAAEVEPEGDPQEAFRQPVPRGLLPPAVAGTTRLPRGLSALRHRNFRLFWSGQLISLIGTWMQQVGQAWLVLQLTGDPLALGIVAAAQFTPVLVLGLFAGSRPPPSWPSSWACSSRQTPSRCGTSTCWPSDWAS